MKGIGEGSTIMMNSTQAKLKAVGADEMMNNLVEKLKQLFLMLENFGLFLVGRVDEVSPPETRKERLQHWLRVGAPFVVAGLVILVLYWCFNRCIRCCCGVKAVKMMKAPGANFRIPRHVFEASPKGYFRALHAGKVKF